VSFRRYVDPSDSRQPSTVTGGGFLAAAIGSGALDDATAFEVCFFTGVEAGGFSIVKDAVRGFATSDVEDRSVVAVPVVFEARFTVAAGSRDEAASTAMPALA
jgi:hypothetical protein